MLTQFQTIETQAALLAACPRPRAFAASVITLSAPSVPSAWSHSAPISVPVFAGVPEFGVAALVERPVVGYAPATPSRAMANGTGSDVARLIGENAAATGSKQQDQKHLTARRGPVTWRPPH